MTVTTKLPPATEPPLLSASPLPAALVDLLRLIEASERELVGELDDLFGCTNWIPLRLVLGGQLRETARHLERLGQLIPSSSAAPATAWRAPRRPAADRVGKSAAAAMVVGPLRSSRAAIAAYGTAIGLATDYGLCDAVSLLERSFVEEANTSRRLAALAAECSGN